MKLTVNTSYKNVNPDGQGTAVLEVLFETADTEERDNLAQAIFDFFKTQEEEKARVLGLTKEEVEEDD